MTIQLLDDDERQHDVVFIEAEERMGVGQQDGGVENVGLRAHKGVGLSLGV